MALTRRDALKLGGLAVVALKGENPVVGGTVLRRAAIESPNFVAGSTGWIVRQDGSAEFNNVVIRNGQVISGTSLYYSSTPAFGNLVASVSAAAGTDSFGNAYLAGVASYLGGSSFSAVQLNGGQLLFWAAATAAGPYTQQASAFADNTGDLTVDAGGNINLEPTSSLLVNVPSGQSAAFTGAAASDAVITEQIGSDPHARFKVNGNGSITLGTGALAGDTTWGRIAAGEVGATGSSSLAVATAGQGLMIKEGSNAKQGTAVLVGGTVVVANTSVTANSKIFVGQNTPGGTPGAPFVSSVTVGTGFTVKSTSNLDTSTIGYFITEPA